MMEKIKLSEQINRLNEQLVQRDAEKNTLKERNVELEGKKVAYEQRIRDLERDRENIFTEANVRKKKTKQLMKLI